MTNLSKEDRNLLEGCISGDKKAWDRFVERFSSLIYHSLCRTLENVTPPLDPHDLADLVHTVFLKLHEHNYKKLRQFKGKCSLASWVRMISVRVAIDHLRKLRSHLSLEGAGEGEKSLIHTLEDPANSVQDLLEEKELQKIFQEMQKQLSPRERLFVELYYGKELSPRQVARIMGSSLGAVYTMKNRVREKLKKAAQEFL